MKINMRPLHRLSAFALSALLPTFALPFAAQPQAQARAQTSSDTTFSVPRNAVIDITLRTGRLFVRGTQQSTAELRANDQRYELRSTGVGVTLAARDDRGRDSDNRRSSRSSRDARSDRDGRLELAVPRGVRLVISAGSADVEVQDIAGDVEVHSLSGDISLRAIGGRAIIETLSGDVRLTDGAGDTRANTMSGDIILRGVRGTAHVHTTSGSVTLSMVRAAEVQVESTSGDLVFDGDPTDDARMQLTSHSGDITIRIPESARGTMELATFSGEMRSNRPVTLTSGLIGNLSRSNRNERGTQRYEFGGGGPARFTVTTFSGDIRFDRGTRRNPD